MRALIQRVRHAQVSVEGHVVGSCGAGYLILLGVAASDTKAQAERLWAKISKLRIFEDEQGKSNRSLVDVGGEALIVSQFTLMADTRRGNRPSFSNAARPEQAMPLYEYFCELAQEELSHVGRGVFGAMMDVELINDGPYTIWLDTNELGH